MKNVSEMDEVEDQTTEYEENSLTFEVDAKMTLNSEYDICDDFTDESIGKINMTRRGGFYQKNQSLL